jgi:hypothetical protein
MWLCRCDCGTEKEIEGTKLRTGHTQSCGCYHQERLKAANFIHGHSAGGVYSYEFRTWTRIKDRCLNPNGASNKNYMARGIKLHEPWRTDFNAFLAAVGAAPGEGYTLDRYPNNDGNYEPGNVRWATRVQQGRNTRGNRMITDGNETHCLSEWAEITGIKASVIAGRIDNLDWDAHKALTTPQLKGLPSSRNKTKTMGCANQETTAWAIPGVNFFG